jgi:hypothetical protein
MTLFNIFLKEAVKMAIKYRGSPIFLKWPGREFREGRWRESRQFLRRHL